MKDTVKETSPHEGTEEPNLPHPEFCTKENPEQLECSKSKRVCISEQGGSGEKMVAEIQGETKVEDSSHQAKRRGPKPTLTTAERKERKNERDRKRRRDLNIELGKLREMRPQFEDLKKTYAEVVRENKTLKNKLRENDSMSVQIPMDYAYLEGQENASKDYDLSGDQFFKGIDNIIPSASPNEELATAINKHVTRGKGITEGALELKRKREDELNEARKGKLPISVDDDTPTCLASSSTPSGRFVSRSCQSIRQLATAQGTQNPLPSTAGGAESREATHDKEASTSASGIKGTTDF